MDASGQASGTGAAPEAVGWFRAVVFDADDPPALARFWCAVLGVDIVEAADDWIQLAPDRGATFMAFEPARTGHEARGTNARPDLEVDDLDTARTRIEALGGSLVEVIHARPGESHYRMADPEGNEFTVVLPLPPEVAERAYGSAGAPGRPR